MTENCSTLELQLAIAGSLSLDREERLCRHLEHCEACSAAIEEMAGTNPWCDEAAPLLRNDELDLAVPRREEWSEVDFIVEHLEPSDQPNVLGRLGGYDVLELIGRGGMGIVLKAFDSELKRCVAIKVLAPHLAQSSLAKKRFAREAQAAAAVVHHNVLAIHQVHSDGGLPFLVMPLVAGDSLAERLTAQGRLELQEVLRIGMQAAAGLAAAHEQGIVHRDVKPANILLEKGVERAMLTDFGLARAADDVSLTRWGIIAGTPQYMSPEQARGEPVDGRSDLFSLGCVLYEMATGIAPFRADSTLATLRRLIDEPPPAMSSLNPELPPWFIAIVDRLLEKDPSRRFGSAKEVSELLEGCLAHVQQPASVPLPAASVARRPRLTIRLRKILSKGTIAVIAILGTGLLGILLMYTVGPSNRAEQQQGEAATLERTVVGKTEEPGNQQAIKEFGVARTGPIETGYFIFAGKYIDAPYFVERRGLDTFINDCLVRRGAVWPRTATNPGDPPAHAEADDPYWIKRWQWLCGQRGFPEAVKQMADDYRKSDAFGLVTVKADSRSAEILLVPADRDGKPATKRFLPDTSLADAEHNKDFFVRGLGPGDVLMIETAGVSEIQMGGGTGLKLLAILASGKSPDEKAKAIEAASLSKDASTARKFAAIEVSDQLAKRLAQEQQAAKATADKREPPTKSVRPPVISKRQGPLSQLAIPVDATPLQMQVNELLLRLVYAKFKEPQAENALFALGEPAVRELFRLTLLPTDNYDLRDGIRMLIARFPGDQARQFIEAELLKLPAQPSPDPEERTGDFERFNGAMQILRIRADRSSVPALVKVLDSVPFPDQRSTVIMVLGEIGDNSAAPAIRQYLDDAENMVRSSATGALIRLNAIEVTPELRRRYGPILPSPPQPPQPLALPFASDTMAGVTITIEAAAHYVFSVPPARFTEVFESLSGAPSTSHQLESPLSERGWAWPASDPLIAITLKDGRKFEIMMAVAKKPPFCFQGRDLPRPLFDSPKLAAIVNEAIRAGLTADLADRDFTKEFDAAATLFDRGDTAGHEVLVAALDADKPTAVRAGAAVRLLKECNEKALATADNLAAADLSPTHGQQLVQSVADSFPAKAVPILRKYWREGKFPQHDRSVIQSLGKIASSEAIETLFDEWGNGPDFKMQLVYTTGRYYEAEAKAEAGAWWQKNKGRPRMELLADGYVSDTQGHGYGQYCLTEMRKLDQADAVRELMRRLPDVGGSDLERITQGLQSLTGVFLGRDKTLWLNWWESNGVKGN
jgi:hypothetical protein